MADPLPPNIRLRTTLRLGGFMGFIGGFLFAYQNSSCKRFLGIHRNCISPHHKSASGAGPRTNVRRTWTSQSSGNASPKEIPCIPSLLSHRGYKTLPTVTPYGPNSNSVSAHLVIHHLVLTRPALRGIPDVSLLCHLPPPLVTVYRFNFVNHQHHGADPVKYGVEKNEST